MDKTLTCPLGSECEKIVDGKIEQCRWLTKIDGVDKASQKPLSQEKCAIEWLPILLVDQIGTTVETVASVQSLRNETVDRQNQALGLVREKLIGS